MLDLRCHWSNWGFVGCFATTHFASSRSSGVLLPTRNRTSLPSKYCCCWNTTSIVSIPFHEQPLWHASAAVNGPLITAVPSSTSGCPFYSIGELLPTSFTVAKNKKGRLPISEAAYGPANQSRSHLYAPLHWTKPCTHTHTLTFWFVKTHLARKRPQKHAHMHTQVGGGRRRKQHVYGSTGAPSTPLRVAKAHELAYKGSGGSARPKMGKPPAPAPIPSSALPCHQAEAAR